MNITSDINTAIVVATRFKTANLRAHEADNTIRRFIMDCPTGIMTDNEREVLRGAATILQRLMSVTTEHDAEKYLQKLEPVTEQPESFG